MCNALGVGLMLMAGSTAANSYGEQQSANAQRKVLGAEQARQTDINRRLNQSVEQAMPQFGADASAQAAAAGSAAPIAQANDSQRIAQAFGKASADGGPSVFRGAITSGTRSQGEQAAQSGRNNAAVFGFNRGVAQQGNTLADLQMTRAGLGAESERSASIVPIEMQAAAQKGAAAMSLAQLMGLVGGGMTQSSLWSKPEGQTQASQPYNGQTARS